MFLGEMKPVPPPPVCLSPAPPAARRLVYATNSADLMGPLTGTKDMTPEIKIRPGSKDPLPAAPQADFLPKDEFNTKLVANTGPKDYVNPEPLEKYDLVSWWDDWGGMYSTAAAVRLTRVYRCCLRRLDSLRLP